MTPDELADLEDGLSQFDGADEEDDDPDADEPAEEFEHWQSLGERYREMAHALRLPLMDLRRHLTSGPPDSHWPEALTAGGKVVSQTQAVVNEIEHNADRCERLAWSSYCDYMLRELKSL